MSSGLGDESSFEAWVLDGLKPRVLVLEVRRIVS